MTEKQQALQRLMTDPLFTVDDLAVLADVGRSKAYDIANRAPENEVVRFGKLIRLKSAPWRRKLGLEAA